MPPPCVYLCRGRIAEIQWLEHPTPDTLDSALRELAAHPDFRPGMALLVSVRMADFNPGPRGPEILARTLSDFGGHVDRHIAFVVDSEFHYGVIRAIAEHAEPRGIIVMPFREKDPAEQWLLAQLSDSQYLPIPPSLPPEKD